MLDKCILAFLALRNQHFGGLVASFDFIKYTGGREEKRYPQRGAAVTSLNVLGAEKMQLF